MADKKTGRITIGSNTAEEMWHASSEGKTGTFLISKPDFDALNASLIETPKPSAPTNPAPANNATPSGTGTPPAGNPSAIPAPPPPQSPAPTGSTPAPKPAEALIGSERPVPQSAPKR
jgi:hypothetical protein